MTSQRILLVDDEKGVVRSCTRILQRQGYSVTGTTESWQVPELLRQESYDLIVTDIKMPRLDGLELLKIAREIDPHVTVLLFTGYGTMEDAIRAIRLGAQGFLMKPFEPNELIATIEDNLARRALLRDSLRLQTLLPLLEINQVLQVSGGEVTLAQRVLDIAQQEIGATRLAWLSYAANQNDRGSQLVESAVAPANASACRVSDEAIDRVLASGRPVWLLADGTTSTNSSGQPNIVAGVLPVTIAGQVSGVLTAEMGSSQQSRLFGQISLDVLSVLAGQLAMAVENVQLFQQTETLRNFNEDMIENMSNGIIAIDGAGRITAFNPAAQAMLGYRPEQLLQQPLEGVFGRTNRLVEIFQGTLSSQKAQPRQEISLGRADGQTVPVSVSTALLGHDLKARAMAERPAAGGVIAVLEDLTELKALEEERRRLDRLAVLGEMSAVVAHEIRNPIAGIAAGVEFLTRNIGPDSPDAGGVAMIRSEIKRVNRILEDILFVARPLQLNLARQALPPLLAGVLQRCQAEISANQVAVTSHFAPDLPPLAIDQQRLEQVFDNLIVNAIQAMPEGGQLRLQAAIAPDAPQWVRITIEDTGPGIAEVDLSRIFDPFFTTKARGTGLGLSIARSIVENHNGTLSVWSQPATGTRFTIQLPLEGDIAP